LSLIGQQQDYRLVGASGLFGRSDLRRLRTGIATDTRHLTGIGG
jgi:hypothetical protein